MRRSILRVLAVFSAISGLAFVVAHAGLTAGCGRGTPTDAQNPGNLSNATTQAAAPEPAAAPSPTPTATTPSKAKTRRPRYLPATKAAPVFVTDDGDDDAPPAPPPQQQSAPLRTKAGNSR